MRTLIINVFETKILIFISTRIWNSISFPLLLKKKKKKVLKQSLFWEFQTDQIP